MKRDHGYTNLDILIACCICLAALAVIYAVTLEAGVWR